MFLAVAVKAMSLSSITKKVLFLHYSVELGKSYFLRTTRRKKKLQVKLNYFSCFQ